MSGDTRSDTAAIAGCLGASRRRLFAVRLWTRLSTTVAAALVAGELIVLFATRINMRERWMLAVLTILLSAAAAFLTAWLKRPARADAAKAVDAHLGLGDRLIAAEQFLGIEEPVVRLIERDAARSIAQLKPSRALPFETPRTAVTAALVAAGLPAMFFLGASLYEGSWARGAAIIASRTGLDIPGAEVLADASRPTAAQQASALAPITAPRGIDLTRPEEARTSEAAARSAPSRDASRLDSHGSDSTGPQAPGAKSDDNGGSTASGGVSHGALAPSTVDAADATRSQHDGREYAVAWSRARAAVTREHIPADRRGLISRYFAAIRPSESR